MNTARLIWNHRRRFLRKLEHAEHAWQTAWGHYFLLFAVGWLSCVLPTWLYQTASYWLWPMLTGTALLLSAAIHHPKTGLNNNEPRTQFFRCSIVISIVLSLDFIHQVPDILLALCSSNESNLLKHIAFHWQFFPLTSLTMLALIWLPQHAPSTAARNNGNGRQNLAGNLARNLVRNLAHALGMFCMMACAMRSVNLLCIALGLSLTADALASAMICGMLLYHLGAAKLLGIFKR